MKPQRIRDPLHDLIEFSLESFDQSMWKIVNSREFQRLRRIKQLGFSELVYPGATHNRFSHSVGVFFTSRLLCGVIKREKGEVDPYRAKVAMAAALVHDLGHGPFSHAFEGVTQSIDKALGLPERGHEIWTKDIIIGDTEVGHILANIEIDDENKKGKFAQDVADILVMEVPKDIYHAIVSSQFDADRLDYMRRDRMMTGAQYGGFDFSWIIANLKVKPIVLSVDGDIFGEVDSFVLGNKAFEASESYVVGLFQLYFTVYFHKATRSAEVMLKALLMRVWELMKSGDVEKSGLGRESPIVVFLRDRTLDAYLKLDDFLVWSSLVQMGAAEDALCRELSERLLSRRLFKCVDVGSYFHGNEGAITKFRFALKQARDSGEVGGVDLLEDQPKRNPYKRRSGDSPEALSRILIETSDGAGHEDLSQRSSIVKGLEERVLYRVYARDSVSAEKLQEILDRC